MSLTVSGSTLQPQERDREPAAKSEVVVRPKRIWRTEPDGPHDREVEIWNTETGNWVPAFFSEIRAGDFYLLYGTHLPENMCFYAASDCVRSSFPGRWGREDSAPSFIIKNGTEIRQAPATKDITPAALAGPSNIPLLEKP